MTEAFEALDERPRTDVDLGQFSPSERMAVRTLAVRGSTGRTAAVPAGRFQTVYYVAGDEQAAAERFADVNAEAIADLDLSGTNVLQSNLDREMYDRVLDAAGCRKITTYETVVCETRPDGEQWVIDRQRYETQVDRRYTTQESGSARVPPEVSLEAVFAQFDDRITEADLKTTAIEGDVRQVLDWYRVAPDYDCEPVTVDDQLAVRKRAGAAGDGQV